MRKPNTEKYFKSAVIRRYRKVAAFAVFGFVIGAVLVSLLPQGDQGQFTVSVEHASTSEDTGVWIHTASNPMRLRIPAIELDTAFEEPLGVDANREIEVPESYEEVAYYKHGPTPGEIGPAVVLGHVDSYEGPAIFYDLRQLEVGDRIEIDREDGSTAVFAVDRLATHSQSGFPTAQVYGDLDHAGLRLITCTGSFDHGEQRYSHNLIVFATLVSS